MGKDEYETAAMFSVWGAADKQVGSGTLWWYKSGRQDTEVIQ
jgi:hypothetical protein